MSYEAEQAIIGTMILDPHTIDDISVQLTINDFTNLTLRTLYRELLDMHNKNEIIDVVTLTTRLQNKKNIVHVEFDFIQDIISNVVTTSLYMHYVEIIKKQSVRRRAIEIAEQIRELGEHPVLDEEEFYQKIEKLADSVRTEKNVGEVYDMQKLKQDYLEYMQKKDDYIKTGFNAFDEWCGGIGRGWLYILAARPSTGKTAKMLQMALGIASRNEGGVIIFSQEMKKEALANRWLSNLTQRPLTRIRLKQFEEGLEEEVKLNLDVLTELEMFIADKGQYSMDQIRALSRKVKKQCNVLNAIFIDYLSLINVKHSSNQNYAQALGEASKKSKSLAMELDCPVILLAQLNREAEKVEQPSLIHLKDSGNIEQDADIVELLYEDKESEGTGLEKNIISNIAKGRDVGTKHFKYTFQTWKQTFVER